MRAGRCIVSMQGVRVEWVMRYCVYSLDCEKTPRPLGDEEVKVLPRLAPHLRYRNATVAGLGFIRWLGRRRVARLCVYSTHINLAPDMNAYASHAHLDCLFAGGSVVEA